MIAITAPLFVLLAVGFGAVRAGIVSPEALAGLSRFVLYFALPALMFRALAGTDFGTIINPLYLLAYGTGSLVVLVLGLALARFVIGATGPLPGLLALGMALPNSAFFGYPVLLRAFDDPPTHAFAMCVLVENLLILPLALMAMEYGAGHGRGLLDGAAWRRVFGRVARNPLIIAIVAGIGASLLELQLPGFLDHSLHLLAQSSAALALFVIGGSLVGSRLVGNWRDTGLVAVGKLLLHPLLVWLVVLMLPGFGRPLESAVVVMAAMPMMSIYPIIGSAYGARGHCAGLLLFTTLASFFTIPLMLMLAR